uniref:Aminoglycoside phosphotransferase domain-containing protein 1 n=1 Tax=Lygus hesperus TaxID=30085 RepID=A0A0A9VUG0_LYGHE
MLFQYRRDGCCDVLNKLTKSIDDSRIGEVVTSMLQLQPTQRRTFLEYVAQLTQNGYFPSHFYDVYRETVDVGGVVLQQPVELPSPLPPPPPHEVVTTVRTLVQDLNSIQCELHRMYTEASWDVEARVVGPSSVNSIHDSGFEGYVNRATIPKHKPMLDRTTVSDDKIL